MELAFYLDLKQDELTPFIGLVVIPTLPLPREHAAIHYLQSAFSGGLTQEKNSERNSGVEYLIKPTRSSRQGLCFAALGECYITYLH